jgi:hypothetical protein
LEGKNTISQFYKWSFDPCTVVDSEVDITVVLEQARKISTVSFRIVAAENSQTLAEGEARVICKPFQS